MATILTIIPYTFYPPTSGGALRCFYILREMAREHDVYVLTSQPLQDFRNVEEPAFPENVKIVSTASEPRYQSLLNSILPKRLADAINYRYLKRSIKGSASSYFLEVYPTLLKLLKKVNFNMVYYENLEALSFFSPLVKKIRQDVLQVYDAHNVDSELWIQQASYANQVNYKYAKNALHVEQRLHKNINAFFCCSDEDNKKLTILNKGRITGICIPNGVDTVSRPFDVHPDKHKVKEIIFCGSLDYFPNKEGILWFYHNVFPHIKQAIAEVKLTVFGSLKNTEDYEGLMNDPAVNFIGKVESVLAYYRQSSVAIVPLLSGSGTRLKILEAMSMGNPIVSTTVGAEGLNYATGEDLLIADQPEAFAESILLLLSDHSRFNAIRAHALELVKKNYDWAQIGKLINMKLAELMEGNTHE